MSGTDLSNKHLSLPLFKQIYHLAERPQQLPLLNNLCAEHALVQP